MGRRRDFSERAENKTPRVGVDHCGGEFSGRFKRHTIFGVTGRSPKRFSTLGCRSCKVTEAQ